MLFANGIIYIDKLNSFDMLNHFLIVFGVIFLSQILFFIYAAINKTDKVTDLSYGLTFILGGLAAYILNFEYISLFQTVLLVLVVIWGVRLSTYLFIRVLRIGRDKRFDGIREDVKKFGSFWIIQAISVFVILLPTTYILLSKQEMFLNVISFVGLVIALLGILLEGVADYQKYIFKNKQSNKERWISSGVWKYSRHPNYLGEIMMWVGVFVYALPFINGNALVTILSPIFITLLLVLFSGIPTLERKYDVRYAKDTEYLEYKRRTGVLFPKII